MAAAQVEPRTEPGAQALALRRCQADRSAAPPAPQAGAATELSCPHAHPYRGRRLLGQGLCKNRDSELQSATFSDGYKTSALPFFNYKARNASCPDHLPVTLLERKQMGSKDNVDEHTLKSIISIVIHGKQLSGLSQRRFLRPPTS